uniref:DNA 3'-5' helicase n=1 Tax=mine drainage metagenome TaxID=410659 RepID=E6PXR7_9ZZZZ
MAGTQHLLVRPQPWVPVWLDKDAPSVVDAAIRELVRRPSRLVPADPLVFESAGTPNYVTPGQRAAVQAGFLLPGGSTAIISLPTGGGKTLAFQLPALSGMSQGGLTLVVVPTVALAKDQEDRFLSLARLRDADNSQSWCPLAYHSGLSEEEKRKVRAAIRDGSVPIVFASPEAIMGALRAPLFDAARQGRLKLFAVDEAHVVAQWGQEFRPEFQSIAGLRDALLDACPPAEQFRTLLLTATLTADCYETLRFLFGRGNCQLISELSLRPEPGFLISLAADETVRIARIMEGLRYLPRPLILYATLREPVEEWFYRLRSAGFRRLRMVRGGDLADEEGEAILRDWRRGAIDIIVATSAFGLGMDQSEVRSVIHACLPETIDRYYQEVGRGGRDGKAAAALLVSTPNDEVTAKGLAHQQIISVDRGFERWEAMWDRRKPIGNGSSVVSLDARPADISDTSIRNASWNLRTLVLMVRTGLIRIVPHLPPLMEPAPDEDIVRFELKRKEMLRRFSREVAVRILDSRHLDKAHWDKAVAQTRVTLRRGDERALALVQELRNLKRPLNEIFRETYTLSDPPVHLPRMMGSCPVTRRNGTVSFTTADPELTLFAKTDLALSAELERALSPCLDSGGRYWVAYDGIPGDPREFRNWHENFISLLRHMVAGGVVELSVPDVALSPKEWSQLIMRSANNFIIRTSQSEETSTAAWEVPRLTLLGAQPLDTETVEQAMIVHRPYHVIVVPRSQLDPLAPRRRLLDVRRHLSIEDILARLHA